jgi:hypothetical protein
VEAEGVLEQEFVDGGAGWVWRVALGERGLAVSLRVDIEVAAGKKHRLHAYEQTGYSVLMLVERNDDGRGSGGTQGGKIGR